MTLLAFILGAAFRRWLGSARPSWAFTGYRAAQIGAGFLVLLSLCAFASWDTPLWNLAKAAAVIGFMTLPVFISRRPFEFLAEWLERKGWLPVTRGPILQGAAPWGEVMQGALLWLIAVLV